MPAFFRLLAFLCLLLPALYASAQPKDTVQLQLRSQAAYPALQEAKGFERALQRVHLHYRPARGGRFQPLARQNDSTWQIALPRGIYELQLSAFAFDTLRRYLDLQSDTLLPLELNRDSLPHCYEKGEIFHYLPGGLAFEQTLLLYFASGSAAENQAWLESQLSLRRLEQLAPNVFDITLRLEAQKSLQALLYERQYGALDLGCYLGRALCQALEKIRATGRLHYAVPRYRTPQN